MPQLGFGTWLAKPGEVERAVATAVKSGFRHVDCASIYGNENEVRNGLKEAFDSGIKREDVFITSKLWNTFHKKDDVIPALKRSLNDLGLEYLDLYLIHWPMGYENGGDQSLTFPKTADGKIIFCKSSFLETWSEMEKAVQQGLVKSIGVSNFNKDQIMRILDVCKIKPAVNQVECHPYNNQSEMIQFLNQAGIKLTGYSPFGNPGRPWKGTAKDGANNEVPSLLNHPKIEEIAKKHGKATGHVLLRFQIQRDVIVLTKSVNPDRIKSNFDIFGFELDSDDMAAIEGLNQNLRILPLSWDGIYKHPDYPFTSELNDKTVY